MYKYSKNYFYLKGIKNQQPKSTKNRYFFEQILMTIFEHPTRRGNLRIAQGRAKRRPGYCRPSPVSALKGQKRKNPSLLFVHRLHRVYMLLPLQGESAVVYSSPRAPLRSALGYEQVAPSGRTDGIIPPTISSQPNWFFRARSDLSSYKKRGNRKCQRL